MFDCEELLLFVVSIVVAFDDRVIVGLAWIEGLGFGMGASFDDNWLLCCNGLADIRDWTEVVLTGLWYWASGSDDLISRSRQSIHLYNKTYETIIKTILSHKKVVNNYKKKG